MSSGARSSLELSHMNASVLFPLLRWAARIEKQKRSTLALLWLMSYRQANSLSIPRGGAQGTCFCSSPHGPPVCCQCTQHQQTASEQRHASRHRSSCLLLLVQSHHLGRSGASPVGNRRVLTNWNPQHRNNSDEMRLSPSARRCPSAAPVPRPQPRGRFRRPGKSCREGENIFEDRRRCPQKRSYLRLLRGAHFGRVFPQTMTASSRLATMTSGAVDGFRPSILCSLNVATCTHAILIAAVIIHGVDGAPHPMLSGRWEWPRKIVRWHASFERNQLLFIISLSVPLLLMIRRAA
ncbi:hypothetical protein IWX49DRAFT_325686 [Phyllosticta citricarpa]|uniref:Uncharacterized protein n=2 Tax=Phyllosticta TaxID=121621 RepID=A0ABR1LMT4_9PEZI